MFAAKAGSFLGIVAVADVVKESSAAAMGLSPVSVLPNALRLKRFRPR